MPRISGFAASVCAAALLSGCYYTDVGEPRYDQFGVRIMKSGTTAFRDLDRSGDLTPYENPELTSLQRAADLLSRLTLPEKAGLMVVATAPNDAPRGEPATAYDLDAVERLNHQAHVTHFISRLSTDAPALAAANNGIQQVAANSRLGIPAIVMTDPRHGYTELAGASVEGGQFSQWPNNLAFAALGDPQMVFDYARIMGEDLRQLGFHMILGPQIDLATEPRWPRNYDTFGEDPEVAAVMANAYVAGVQGTGTGGAISRDGVAAVVKHFAGYSASRTGFDAHNHYGRHSVLNADEWELHIAPFVGALAADPAGVMPAYSILQELELDGEPVEQVGVGFNRRILRGELRERLGFEGVVISDWLITADCTELCVNGHPEGEPPSFATVSTAWGVEDLTVPQRFAKGIEAGIDIFGGVDDPSPIVEAVDTGLVEESLVDAAVLRILVQTFDLGLFDHVGVSPRLVAEEVAEPDEVAQGQLAMAASMVLLEANRDVALPTGARVVLSGVDAAVARDWGFVPVEEPADADFAILRTQSPFELLHPGYMFGSMHQEGSLAFPDEHPALAFLSALPDDLPVVADVQLDRPAILTPIRDRADVLLASFGASDAALMQVLTGLTAPSGRLPFELPRSMAAVEAQRPGTPADSVDPLYPLGYRLSQ